MRQTRTRLDVNLGVCAMAAMVMLSTPAFAQTAPVVNPLNRDTRLPIVVADLRGVFGRIGQDESTAKGLSTSALTLPASALGAAGGVHVYVWRGRTMSLGVGAEGLFARASKALVDVEGKETGIVIDRRVRSASAQLSLNFGKRAGWSYVTAGFGPTSFDSYFGSVTPDGLKPASLNFGGGARWFNWEHLAFTADLRFYATKPTNGTPNTAARARKNLLVLSAGISVK